MKALVTVPPVCDFYFTGHRFSALGAHIVADILESCGITPVLLNFPLLKKKPTNIPLPPEFHYLKPWLIPGETGKLSYFTGLKYFGPAPAECAAMVKAENPDILFISCFAFCYSQAALELAAAVKECLPGIPVAAGGAGVTAYPEYFIRHPQIDYAFTGEAEVSLPAFLEAITGSREPATVPNLYRKRGKSIIKPGVTKKTTENELRFTWSRTRETGQRLYLATSLSRGCPRRCRFCSNYADNEFRMVPFASFNRGLERLATALAAVSKTISLNFEDDNLLTDADAFFKMLAAVKRSFPSAEFYAENGIDYTCLDRSLTERLLLAGMQQFNISLGSIHPLLLTQEERRADLAQYLAVLDVLDEYRIPSVSYFICGFRNETREHTASTLSFLADKKTLAGISLFYAVPGLPDFRDYSLFDSLSPLLCLGGAAYPWNRSLTTGTMVTAFRLSRLINLLKSRHKTAEDRELLARIAREKKLCTVVKQDKKHSFVPVPHMDEELVSLVLSNLQLRISF